jgi:endoglucanase
MDMACFKMLIILFLFSLPDFSFKENPKDLVPFSEIQLDQVGYFPKGKKLAYYLGSFPSDKFFLVDSAQNQVVYSGKIKVNQYLAFRSHTPLILDFTSFIKEGTFRIRIPGYGYSYYFKILPSVYKELGKASLKGFYFQRASIDLAPEYAGKWARKAGHPDTSVLIHGSASGPLRLEGYKVNSRGGWYDAGDYNKYIVNSGISTATLLSAYEDFPDFFRTLKTSIPESNNGLPDILDESLYNIRWMLSMQDPDDGGVYHKCTNADFDPMVMPEQAKKRRYLVQKTTAASLDFAAVMAQSARIFSSFGKELPGLADSCFRASEKAWDWANRNPQVLYKQNEMNKSFSPAIHTGEYGDSNLEDEKFWAEAEIYCTYWSGFSNKANRGLLMELLNAPDQSSIPSWSKVGMLGYYSLLRIERHIKWEKGGLLDIIKSRILQQSLELIKKSKYNGYQTIMGGSPSDYVWGSNAVAANQGILLINAYRISHFKPYLDLALTNLHYLLGQNPTGYCFVTGFGTRSPMHPHHRISIADGILDPVPGLLVGGPNPGRQDGQKYEKTDPDTAYTDQDGAYASNEIAINWNAPLVYLVNGIEALYPNK